MTFCNCAQAQQPETPRYDSSEDLLLVIDFQNVYLPGQPWACPSMERSIENTLNILGSPDAPDHVFTKYVAPENPVGRWNQYIEEYAEINADEFLCDLADPITKLVNNDNLIIKDTYSAMDSTALRSRLAGKKRVVLTGVVAECCILATMMDAIDLGYEVIYLYDCISGQTDENEEMIRTLAESFSPIHTQVMSSSEYMQLISNDR